jgi:hypothetical protein
VGVTRNCTSCPGCQPPGGGSATAVTATFDADPAERFTYGLQAFLNGIRRELAL